MNIKYDLKDLKKAAKQNLLNDTQSQKETGSQQNLVGSLEQTKRGRRPKPKEKRLTEKVTVNFTNVELENLRELASKNFDIPLPKLIRGILKEHNII